MARADKATAVADIAEQFRDSTATVITEYRGLSVANLAELRRSLARLGNLLGCQEHADQAGRFGGGHRGSRRAVRRTDRDRVRQRRGGRCRQGHQDLRQRAQGAGHQGWLHGRSRADRRRSRAHRRPGVARGAAGQTGRGDEGQPVEGRRAVQRAGLADRQARCRTAGEEGRRRACGSGRGASRRGSCSRGSRCRGSAPEAPAAETEATETPAETTE